MRVRANCTHTSGVRPLVAVEGALVVHGGEHGDERDAVREAEDRYLRPLKALLDDEARAALAEDALLHGGADGSAGLLAAHGDGDALAEGEAVGLDDEGQGRGLDVGHGCVEVVEDLIGGGGYAVLFHEALGKDLAALYLRRGLRRAEGRHADVLKGVGHAEAEGVVGRDDGEVYARLAREVHGALYIRGAARDADRHRPRCRRCPAGRRFPPPSGFCAAPL